jgi:superoxide dismutase, Cu-Zn family
MKRGIGVGCLVFLLAIAYGLSGCFKGAEQGTPGTKAIAMLYPTLGSKAQGTVSFSKERDGMHVEASIQGLIPGLHGFHLHEFGDCTSPDANSAGGHFNPTNMPHGSPTADKRHAGDFGNLQADAGGNAKLKLVVPVLSFEGPNSILGRGVIVHAQADDFTTQPTGAAGARVACGVVGVMK